MIKLTTGVLPSTVASDSQPKEALNHSVGTTTREVLPTTLPPVLSSTTEKKISSTIDKSSTTKSDIDIPLNPILPNDDKNSPKNDDDQLALPLPDSVPPPDQSDYQGILIKRFT